MFASHTQGVGSTSAHSLRARSCSQRSQACRRVGSSVSTLAHARISILGLLSQHGVVMALTLRIHYAMERRPRRPGAEGV
jgi:hypothetical protein